MKKFFLLLTLFASTASALNFTTNLDAGRLRGGPTGANALPFDNTNGSPAGGLLVLVAAGEDSTFSNSLAPGQVVSANDILLGVAGFNTNNGLDETQSVFNILNSSAVPGDLVALRWFSTLTLSQYNAGSRPIAGSTFGTYNPRVSNPANLTLPNPDAPDGGASWVVPGGGTVALNFFTTDSTEGGSQFPSEGFQPFVVVPEPSTYLTLCLGLLVGCFALKRRFAF